MNQPAPSPRELVPEIPPELEAVVLKALAKDPAQRYPDAESFMRDLEAVESRLDRGPVDTESTAVFAPVAAGTAPTAPPPAPPAAATPPPPPPPVEPPPPPPGRGAARGPPRRAGAAAGSLLARRLLALAALARDRRSSLLRSPNQVTVPQVVGPDARQRARRARARGPEVDVKRRADPAPRGHRLSTRSPAPGAKVGRRLHRRRCSSRTARAQ